MPSWKVTCLLRNIKNWIKERLITNTALVNVDKGSVNVLLKVALLLLTKIVWFFSPGNHTFHVIDTFNQLIWPLPWCQVVDSALIVMKTQHRPKTKQTSISGFNRSQLRVPWSINKYWRSLLPFQTTCVYWSIFQPDLQSLNVCTWCVVCDTGTIPRYMWYSPRLQRSFLTAIKFNIYLIYNFQDSPISKRVTYTIISNNL